MPRTLYVLHHSHTDVGYTELQARVERWHVGFIRQALEIVRGKDDNGFRWICETFWAVERFLDQAPQAQIDVFVEAVHSGRIGLSASYLNLSELLDFPVLSRMIGRAAAYGASIGVAVDSAMTADVNGFGWGFARALHDHGVRNLFTCVHTHHGRYPLERPQTPFWWETPQGGKLLVWSGEHYHYGNELGLVPGAVSSYLTKDECDAEMIFSDPWGVAEIRIPRYFDRLAREGYPYDFAPVMASGLRTDNAPPNAAVGDFIARWNAKHGDRVSIEMTTLGGFFERLRSDAHDLPVHRGDWPDWWSEGASADATSTRIFRQTQRDHAQYLQLTERHPRLRGEDLDPIERDLTLYAEHTFGHAAAMSRPWHPLVQGISTRKRAYAAAAQESLCVLRERAIERLGGGAIRPGRPLRYKLINTLPREADDVVRLPVSHFELHELRLDRGARAIDAATDERLASQRADAPGLAEFCVPIRLEAGGERVLELQAVDEGATQAATRRVSAIETPQVRIEWHAGEGIVGWTDLQRRQDLLRPGRPHAPFTLVHEKTPVASRDRVCAVRGEMLLNRKGPDAQRSSARFLRGELLDDGDVFCTALLTYEVPGTTFCEVELRAYVGAPRVDVSLRFHKESAWEPENLYLSLPFANGGPDGQLWLDKAGAPMRPRIDQIPGTLTDFYAVQEGLAVVSPGYGVAIGTPDGHLIQLGPLEHGARPLAGAAELERDPAHVYAWLMTNYWETNFAASLGGFHEFRYSVLWGDRFADPAEALATCRAVNQGIFCFRLVE
jgi:hypothetical protein